MYDVVNILESIRIIAKKGKNQYSWKGFGEVPRALEELKEDGVREKSNHSGFCNPVEIDFILLDDAAQALLGDKHDTTALRTKVRRLYDIANVFSSMNMIEKTHLSESRKPAFRWLGWKEKPKNGSVTPSDLNESKKRVFGSDITNDISKRNRVESSTNWINQTVIDVPMHTRHGDLGIVHDGIKLKQRSKHSSKGIEFGPFAPVNVSGLKDPEGRRVIELQGNLTSTYRPQ
ncbi:hypothetical protein I3842_03G027800 [Carya illinoinensis]|nr:hypothetical protein I3842_03G027800 [Carya illinoinensis]